MKKTALLSITVSGYVITMPIRGVAFNEKRIYLLRLIRLQAYYLAITNEASLSSRETTFSSVSLEALSSQIFSVLPYVFSCTG